MVELARRCRELVGYALIEGADKPEFRAMCSRLADDYGIFGMTAIGFYHVTGMARMSEATGWPLAGVATYFHQQIDGHDDVPPDLRDQYRRINRTASKLSFVLGPGRSNAAASAYKTEATAVWRDLGWSAIEWLAGLTALVYVELGNATGVSGERILESVTLNEELGRLA